MGAALVAYHNTPENLFVFDDLARIVNNSFIRHLWPPWLSLAETTRPLVQLTFALNHAMSGLDVWSYRITNVAIHAFAGLALFGVLRRSLVSPGVSDPIRRAAPSLALVAALIWTVHPLQTETVSYAVQRAESLASLFYLLTLYLVIRGAEVTRRWPWHAAAVAGCALGLASKPIVATVPLAVLVYDRMFLSGSWRQVWRERRGLYLGLIATLGLLPVLAANGRLEWRSSAGFGVAEVTPLGYAMTEPGVLVHYLRLCLWPHPLCLDYWWPIARSAGEVVGPGLVVAALLGLAVVSACRGRRLGYLGVWFFLILAPTSSVIPVADAAFEHRLHLPLAAVVVLVTLAAHHGLRVATHRLGWPPIARRVLAATIVAAVAGTLAHRTMLRNADYRNGLTIWTDTVAKRPGNPRARTNLGMELIGAGRAAEGIAQLEAAVRIEPDYAPAHVALGFFQATSGEPDAALSHARAVVRLAPGNGEAHFLLGSVLLALGQVDEAYVRLVEAARLEPTRSATHVNLGAILEGREEWDAAIGEYAEAVRLKPDDGNAHARLGLALAHVGRRAEARRELETAVRLRPGDMEAREALRQLGGGPP